MASINDLIDVENRKNIIDEINGTENQDRKSVSFRECEVYANRLHQYVTEELEEAFGVNAAKQMPKISSINLASRVVKEEATIYKEKPRRIFSGASKDQQKTLDKIYSDMMANTKLLRSNEYYKLQNQSLLMVIPIDGKLSIRVLKSHQYDVIPNPINPEIADGYIISAFDREDFVKNRKTETPSGYRGDSKKFSNSNTDGTNQRIGDPDDYKAKLDRYLVWTKELNFIMDGTGEILSEDTSSPIPGVLPFIDVANNKEFEYFVRDSSALSDFTIQYNMGLSDLNHVVRMQGWSQAIIKGDKKLMVNDMTVGVTKVLFLPIDPNKPVETDFTFANPNPDLDGSIKFIEMLLANFLTSKGVDSKTVTGKADANRFSSGIERLLSMIDKFEASLEDYMIYESVEEKLFDLIRFWHNALINKKELNDKYKTKKIDEKVELEVAFKKPEMIQTGQEKLDFYSQKIAMGMASTVDAVMDIDSMSRIQAIDKLKLINKDQKLEFLRKDILVLPQGTNVQKTNELIEDSDGKEEQVSIPENKERSKTDDTEKDV